MTTFRAGVFATIRDERGHVLLCHRTDCDWWNQPGGGLESGETPWQGVVREVREECGLEVVVERLAGVYSWATKKDEIIFSFVCRVTGGTLSTSDEADDVRYFAPDAFPPNTFPEHVSRICDALRDDPATMLRVPTGPSSSVLAHGEGG
jgi:8-oxo-dGTP diphosphatase